MSSPKEIRERQTDKGNMKKTSEDRKRFVENCKNKVDRQFKFYSADDGSFDSKAFIEDVEKKNVHLARHGMPGTFLMRKIMSYYDHKGTNGSAAMMFEKCFPGAVKWVTLKAEIDEKKWKSLAKARRGQKKRKRKRGSLLTTSTTTNRTPACPMHPQRRCRYLTASHPSNVLSSMQLLVQAAQQQLSQV